MSLKAFFAACSVSFGLVYYLKNHQSLIVPETSGYQHVKSVALGIRG